MTRLSLRSYYWGAIVMVVASGELDAKTTERFDPYLRRLQAGNDLIVDLWDVAHCDPIGIATLAEASERATEAGWGFAVVIDPARAVRRGVRIRRRRHPGVQRPPHGARGAAVLAFVAASSVPHSPT